MRTAAALLLAAATAAAQTPADILESHNAALAYSAAAACMVRPTDEQVSLGSKITSGEIPWDEKALGPFLDANWEALHLLREGSRAPFCGFHLDISLGLSMPLPHLGQMRMLSRINAWDACRGLALSRGLDAADALIAGLRLAAHLGSDGPIIQALVANAILGITTEPLHRGISGRLFDVPTMRRIESALRDLPPDVADWNRAMAGERACVRAELDRIQAATDPESFFASIQGISPEGEEDGPGRKRTALDLAIAKQMFRTWGDDYLKFFDRQARALALPWPEAETETRRLEKRLPKEGVMTRILAPVLGDLNQSRGRAAAARAGLIALCAVARAEETAGEDCISLDGLDVPPEPFTGESFCLERTADGYEIIPAGRTGDGKLIVYRLKAR